VITFSGDAAICLSTRDTHVSQSELPGPIDTIAIIIHSSLFYASTRTGLALGATTTT